MRNIVEGERRVCSKLDLDAAILLRAPAHISLKTRFGMHRRTSFLALAILLMVCAKAFAWNSVGHMTVAYAAYQQLTPTERARVAALLKLNPYYSKWVAFIPAGTSAAEQDMYVFMMAATWSDEIRADNTFSGNDDIPKGELPSLNDGYGAKLRHEYWHFVDTPFSTDGTALPPVPSPTVVQKIIIFRAALATGEPDLLKSYDLVWLIHLVGDVHQPLHCTTRVSQAKPRGDLGGNLVVVQGPAKELHAFWDDAVGLGSTQNFLTVVKVGQALPAPDPSLVKDDHEGDWATESFSLAKSSVYVAPVGAGLGPYDLSGTYTTNAHQLAEARIALAGGRLANLLKKALNCGDTSCAN
ncbi:MAG: S1/P1 nuclease [Terracidiphilus sp.]